MVNNIKNNIQKPYMDKHTGFRINMNKFFAEGLIAYRERSWEELHIACHGGLLLFRDHGFHFPSVELARFRTWAAMALIGMGQGHKAAEIVSEGWESEAEQAFHKPYLALFLFCACQDETLKERFQDYSDVLADLLVDAEHTLEDMESLLMLSSYFLVQNDHRAALRFLEKYRKLAAIKAFPHLSRKARCLEIIISAKHGDIPGMNRVTERMYREKIYRVTVVKHFNKQLKLWQKQQLSLQTMMNEKVEFDWIWEIWCL